MHTVFQIAGPETPGLLAEVTQLLSHNGLEIRTAAVSCSYMMQQGAPMQQGTLLWCWKAASQNQPCDCWCWHAAGGITALHQSILCRAALLSLWRI